MLSPVGPIGAVTGAARGAGRRGVRSGHGIPGPVRKGHLRRGELAPNCRSGNRALSGRGGRGIALDGHGHAESRTGVRALPSGQEQGGIRLPGDHADADLVRRRIHEPAQSPDRESKSAAAYPDRGRGRARGGRPGGLYALAARTGLPAALHQPGGRGRRRRWCRSCARAEPSSGSPKTGRRCWRLPSAWPSCGCRSPSAGLPKSGRVGLRAVRQDQLRRHRFRRAHQLPPRPGGRTGALGDGAGRGRAAPAST